MFSFLCIIREKERERERKRERERERERERGRERERKSYCVGLRPNEYRNLQTLHVRSSRE